MENYYKALGIQPTASTQQIKQAYKTLSARHDAHNTDEKRQEAAYYNLTVAYNTLVDKTKRNEYDRILNSILTVPEYHAAAWSPAAAHTIVQKENNKKIQYGIILAILMLLVLFGIGYRQMTGNETSKTMATSSSEDITPSSVAEVKANNEPIAVKSHAAPLPSSVVTVVSSSPARKKTPIASDKAKSRSGTAHKQVAFFNSASVKATAALQNNATTTGIPNNIGATKEEVLAMFGTPQSIVRYDNNNETWSYANNTIRFCNGRIISFKEASGRAEGTLN